MTRYAATASTRRMLRLEDEPRESAWDRAAPPSDPAIGQYVTRVATGNEDGDYRIRRLTKPHLTDSTVADEPFTRCGRRLRKREGTTFLYEGTPARRICEGCAS